MVKIKDLFEGVIWSTAQFEDLVLAEYYIRINEGFFLKMHFHEEVWISLKMWFGTNISFNKKIVLLMFLGSNICLALNMSVVLMMLISLKI